MALFKKFFGMIKLFYIGGKPRHVQRPDDSVFKRLAAEDVDIMAPQELRETFSNKYLVVRSTPPPSTPSNQANSRKLTPEFDE